MLGVASSTLPAQMRKVRLEVRELPQLMQGRGRGAEIGAPSLGQGLSPRLTLLSPPPHPRAGLAAQLVSRLSAGVGVGVPTPRLVLTGQRREEQSSCRGLCPQGGQWGEEESVGLRQGAAWSHSKLSCPPQSTRGAPGQGLGC